MYYERWLTMNNGTLKCQFLLFGFAFQPCAIFCFIILSHLNTSEREAKRWIDVFQMHLIPDGKKIKSSVGVCSLPTWWTTKRHKNGNLVLDSWLVSFYPDNNWKWMYNLPYLQQAAASHQNQHFYRFTGSGRFRCGNDHCFYKVYMWDGKWLQKSNYYEYDCMDCKELVRVCVCDELVQFSPRSPHCCCKAFKILNFHEESTRHSNRFLILGTSGGISNHVRTRWVCFYYIISISCFSLSCCLIFGVPSMYYVNILLCVHVTCRLSA